MPREVSIAKVLTAGTVDIIAAGQSLAAAGTLTLKSSPVTLDTQRRVLITSAGDDSKAKFTITGSNQSGAAINEIVSGVSADAVGSTLDFLNVGTVYSDSKIASTVTVGTSGTGSTPWQMPNYNMTPFNAQLNTAVTGSVTYTAEYTMDNFALPANPTPQPTAITLGTLSAKTDAQALAITSPIVGWRSTVTSGTGTVTTKFLQAGITNS